MKPGYLSSLKEGYMIYCTRGHYIRQSEPQGLSLGKTVVIDQETGECPECDREVNEAQAVLGRLGLPQGDSNENKV